MNDDSMLVSDITNIMEYGYDRETQTIAIPECVRSLKGRDVNIDLETSNTVQQIRLPRNHNIATKKQAIIFVHSGTGGMLDENTQIAGRSWKEIRLGIDSGSIDVDEFESTLSKFDSRRFTEIRDASRK